MNTIKNLIHTYRGHVFLASLASQFFCLVNLFNIAVTGHPEFNRNDLTMESDMILLCWITGVVISYVIAELHSVTISLLPASTLRKYATALVMIIFAIASCLLFSMAVDLIGSYLTAGSSQAASFALGGYIRYVSEKTIGFSLFAAFAALEISVATLIRRKNIHLCINLFLSTMLYGGSFMLQLHKIGFSPTICGLYWGLAISFIILSYQTYERWQPANNGFFTI